MAGRRPPSDLGSDWINVPRKFRGIKDTSSPTELAYITGAEKGLLSRFANANQVGPENIPSFDDSGMSEDFDWSDYDKNKKSGWTPSKTTGGYDWSGKGSSTGGFRYTPPTKTAKVISRGGGSSVSRATAEKEIRDREMAQSPTGKDTIASKLRQSINQGSGQHWDEGVEDDSNRWKHVPEGGGDKDNKTGGDTRTTLTCAQRGLVDDGAGGCKPKSDGAVTDEETKDDGTCPGCDTTTHDCVNGNCTPKTTTGGDEDGDGTPSLTTITQPDETPMLQELTNEMDLRNMLTNVLNKNNPLFKQARTRALQAMAARGVANSSMAEEAVMSAVMNVAMPIATRVIDDLQRVMAANVNASNEFKAAVNQAYYSELLKRVDAANAWNLERMKSQQVNWQAMLEMKGKAADISDEGVFDDYMEMLKLTPGYHDQPTWNVGQT